LGRFAAAGKKALPSILKKPLKPKRSPFVPHARIPCARREKAYTAIKRNEIRYFINFTRSANFRQNAAFFPLWAKACPSSPPMFFPEGLQKMNF
jgi:hypothetical protein